jgi:ADP-heptose:LPS heptosyltransferase
VRTYSKKKVIFSLILENCSSLLILFLSKRKKNTEKPIRSILLVEPFQMGDVLSLTPIIDPLRRKYVGANIFVLTKYASGRVLEFDARIKQVFFSNFFWSAQSGKKIELKRIIDLIKYTLRLRNFEFDLGIDTRGDIRSQILLLLVGCRFRLGYTNYLHSNINLAGHLLTHKKKISIYRHRYEWNLDLLTAIGFQKAELFPIEFPSLIPDRLQSAQENTPSLVIHVGGGWEYRRWPVKKWILLVDHLQKYSTHDHIAVIGGPTEESIVAEIATGVTTTNKTTFKITSFEELVLLVKNCNQFIGLDSGPMNLAVCLNKPVVALFGPGDEAMWQPLNRKGNFIKKAEKFSCSPCLQLNCIFPIKNCMHEIEPYHVIDKLNSINN